MEAFSVVCDCEICGREACLLQLPETGRASLGSVTIHETHSGPEFSGLPYGISPLLNQGMKPPRNIHIFPSRESELETQALRPFVSDVP